MDDNLEILTRRPELNNLTPYSYGPQPIIATSESSTIKTSPSSTDVDIDGYNSNNLTTRILRIKEDLLLVSQNQPPKYIVNFLSEASSEVQTASLTTASTNTVPSSSSSSPTAPAPLKRLRILVREDGWVHKYSFLIVCICILILLLVKQHSRLGRRAGWRKRSCSFWSGIVGAIEWQAEGGRSAVVE